MSNTPSNIVGRYAAMLITVGLVVWLEFSVTMEWSSPYCTSQEDGPGYAAFGMPFPYLQFGGASSLEYAFMPHIYLLNIIVLCALLFPVIRRALDRPAKNLYTRRRVVIGWLGLVLLAVRTLLLVLTISIGFLQPTSSIGDVHEPYTHFRPVGFCLNDGHYECKPSTFWFPEGWKHD